MDVDRQALLKLAREVLAYKKQASEANGAAGANAPVH
jgi:hypothetical protein